jgi:hypothetical protein
VIEGVQPSWRNARGSEEGVSPGGRKSAQAGSEAKRNQQLSDFALRGAA